MESPSGQRETTPETHPTQGVYLSSETITHIINTLVPGCQILAIDPLEHGRSFNNRIYFFEDTSVNDLVLKLNGKFFDQTKSENEVSGLSLFEYFAPEIPAPRVLAWSDSKNFVIHKLTVAGTVTTKELDISSEDDGQLQGWILMTRLPGIPLSTLNLDTETDLTAVAEQLADMVYRWRQSLPAWATAGNLKCSLPLPHGTKNQDAKSVEVAGLHISSSSYMPGFVVNLTVEPITTQLQYYRVRLETRLQKLQELDVFSENRDLIPRIQKFITIQLPKLGISKEQKHFFLHTLRPFSPQRLDFVGRPHEDLLVSLTLNSQGSSLNWDEFVNYSVANEGDWPDAFYEAYLSRLEACGMNTPRKGIEEQYWREATSLARLEDNIAPWWLENVAHGNKDPNTRRTYRSQKK
ncbi:hypothetical protein ASPBRDRAFT_661134 [Aspergillus brasiliensis CBS 101740]|uniref:Aminoglycoside phosphotransferase domain-containing protein n=1 Tax=Aspergillus brasiliensis (strain CBS 101740 / IMI 381727 / IBT 21946) TaxID=767769 RepID=A0A1L9U7Z8_ASPBC|nr:hypothetical protein ASPBRDRAFT_661134 [Aspergillus brasiliensis CBS 101740]